MIILPHIPVFFTGSIVTYVFLLIFAFGLFFSLVRAFVNE